MVSFDYLLGSFLMARNAGFSDDLYHPKMKKVAEWFAKISTPPDSRAAGTRHFPSIGNTYIAEPTGEFGILAYLWRHTDARFASEMQWMNKQHGARTTPGIGGFFPTLAGYRTILRDETIPAVAPAYGSEWFSQTGVVLRNAFPSGRETGLYMIAGRNHDHYDKDSGSITLWGKGRIVADDFGYYGRAAGEDHSMLLSPSAPDIDLMMISEFGTSARLDYVRGQKKSWTRRLLSSRTPTHWLPITLSSATGWSRRITPPGGFGLLRRRWPWRARSPSQTARRTWIRTWSSPGPIVPNG